MRSFLLKILILIVSCCFFISATETDIGTYHQTFFDDDDTYIPSAQQNLEAPNNQVFLQKTGFTLFNQFANFRYSSYRQRSYGCCREIDKYLSTPKRKIFLENSSLLI
jgi:hypothetical protein